MRRVYIESHFGRAGYTVEVKRFTGFGPDGETLAGERIGRVYRSTGAAQAALAKLLASGTAEWYGKRQAEEERTV